MQVCLLYPDSEWQDKQFYFDEESILSDLGLKTLFSMTAAETEEAAGLMQSSKEDDAFLCQTMKKIMMRPLRAEEEIIYRQDILKDFLAGEEFLEAMYKIAAETMESWNRLGHRKAIGSNPDAGTNRMTDLHILRLFTDGLAGLRNLTKEQEAQLQSEGLKNFTKRLQEDFPEALEENLNQLLADLAFYADTRESPLDKRDDDKILVQKARILLQSDISRGLKLGGLRLAEVETYGKKFKKPKNKKTFLDKCFGAFISEDASLIEEDDILLKEAKQLKYQIVNYIMSYCDSFTAECKKFFEQLMFQTGFYMGALRISRWLKNRQLDFCYPKVVSQDALRFTELKDIVMAKEQDIFPVGNDCDMKNKMLFIVTGANQGGKSTFLRSIGIAQIMMQCGLFVGAKRFESGIFPAFFTHFTRREDSAMNSGRLDEELGRMSQIIENLDGHSLILLNESFATTTEKEGSIIAYGIIKALMDSGVKVLMVTHLLSFAKQIYEEGQDTVEFLSAQRKEDGRRTFKMIQHEPELTSFGLDLYDEIIRD